MNKQFDTDLFDKWYSRMIQLKIEDGLHHSKTWCDAYLRYLRENSNSEDLNSVDAIREDAQKVATECEFAMKKGKEFGFAYRSVTYPMSKGNELTEKWIAVMKRCKNYPQGTVWQNEHTLMDYLSEGKSVEFVSLCAAVLCGQVCYYKIDEQAGLCKMTFFTNSDSDTAERYASCVTEGYSKEQASAYLLCYDFPWLEDYLERTSFCVPRGAMEFLSQEFPLSKITKEVEETFQSVYATSRVFEHLSKKESYIKAFEASRKLYKTTQKNTFLLSGNPGDLDIPSPNGFISDDKRVYFE